MWNMDTYLGTNLKKLNSLNLKVNFRVSNILFLFFLLHLSSCTLENNSDTEAFDMLYVNRNDADMPVYIHGNISSNVFIIVLHGGPGGNGLLYRPGVFSEELEKKYALVYFDQRGQGMAQGHLNSDQITIEEMVKDVNALTQILKHKYGNKNSFFLLGHSWGGTLGSAYMSTDNYQNDFKGWIEVDGAHDFDLILKSQIPLFQSIGNEQVQQGNHESFWNDAILTVESIDTANYSLENLSELNALAFKAETNLALSGIIRNSATDYLNLSVAFKSFVFSENPLTSFVTGVFTNYTLVVEHETFKKNLTSSFNKIKLPTLLMWGKFDFVVPVELGYQALNLIGADDKKLVVFQNSGHSPMTTEGGEFASEIVQFIEAHK